MSIEDLSKTQLLLLTILVNFVTSIATGVLTVSLLDDTSPTITQTVNRIVERTVESVATQTPIPDIIKEPEVAPTDEELRTAAISAASGRVVSIYRSASAKTPIAVGTYLPDVKAVVTVGGTTMPAEVVITFADGTSLEASRSKTGSGMVVYGFGDDATLPKAQTGKLVAQANLKQGQTVLGLASGAAVRGIITKLDASTFTSDVTSIAAGGSAVDLSGGILGISTGAGSFITADVVKALLATPAA